MSEQLTGNVNKIEVEIVDMKRRIDTVENSNRRHDEDIRSVYTSLEGNKMLISQILDNINKLDTKIFSLLGDMAKSNKEERQDWKELIKYIIGATIGVIVFYFFGKI